MYELFVDPFFAFPKTPQLRVQYANQTNTSVPLTDHFIMKQILQGLNFTDLGGHLYEREFNDKVHDWAIGSRKLWHDSQVPTGVRFYNIYSDTTPTIFDLEYQVQVQSSLSEIRNRKAIFSYAPGDGTVPVVSAVNDGYTAVRRVAIPDVDHFNLVKDQRTFQWLRDFQMLQCPLNGWWNEGTEFLGPYLQIHQKGRQVYFFASLQHQRTLVEATYSGGVVAGSFMDADENVTFTFNVSRNCLYMTADIVHQKETFQYTIQRRIGLDCLPHTMEPCSIKHGKGVKRCYYGYYSPVCEITSCEQGYCPVEDASLAYYASCQPCTIQHNELCPFDAPWLCHNGNCVANLHDCHQFVANDHDCAMDEFYCDDKCTKNLTECLPQLAMHNKRSIKIANDICPKEAPFRCLSGHCVEKTSACPEYAVSEQQDDTKHHVHHCPPHRPILCSSGECHRSFEMCMCTTVSAPVVARRVTLKPNEWKYFYLEHVSNVQLRFTHVNATVYVRYAHLPSVWEYDGKSGAKQLAFRVCRANASDAFVAIWNEHDLHDIHVTWSLESMGLCGTEREGKWTNLLWICILVMFGIVGALLFCSAGIALAHYRTREQQPYGEI